MATDAERDGSGTTPTIQFHVDTLGSSSVVGWVKDSAAPSDSAIVEIVAGSRILASGLGNRPRPDLGRRFGHGAYGFVLRYEAPPSGDGDLRFVVHDGSGNTLSFAVVQGAGSDEQVLLEPDETTVRSKSAVVCALARRFGYERYLEVATPGTGFTFASVTYPFEIKHRLLYRCPPEFEDGQDITFRSSSANSVDALALGRTARADPTYDLIFLDPHHTYYDSKADLLALLPLLRQGGALVVHDCLPSFPALAGDEPSGIAWCGETFRAFREVASVHAAAFCTVNVDFGCGVLFPSMPTGAPEWLRSPRSPPRSSCCGTQQGAGGARATAYWRASVSATSTWWVRTASPR